MEMQGTQDNQNNLEKKTNLDDSHFPILKFTTTVIKKRVLA